ncbi:MAG: GC-type dockerin domain-anchored protein [Planctomycetota bacterium]|nr:GC-type dockerin domain-anchored protein [Planctomycetota bacterium]
MNTHKTISKLAIATTLGLIAVLAQAGPQDQFTKYKVGLTIGRHTATCIADTGGTTTISFADAKRMGFLDANGDPEFPADRTQRMGGTGGAVVTCHVFNNIDIEVQPRNADGTPNGPKRTIKVTVFVPKKPSLQTGANDAEKARKTNSVPTKIGANVCGATIDGYKLDMDDKATNNPLKNERSTGWRKIGNGGGGGSGDNGTNGADRRAPVQEDDNYEDEFLFEPRMPDQPIINGEIPIETVQLNLGPISCVGQQAAQRLGIIPVDLEILDFENHQLLFLGGILDTLPDQNNPLVLPFGEALVQIPTLEGDLIPLQPVRFFILPEGNPQSVVLGGNGLVPPEVSFWLDSDLDQILWDFDPPCLADFNGDGAVNTLDVLAFLNAWSAGDESADINGDGEVNTLDVIEFLNAWTTGCG